MSFLLYSVDDAIRRRDKFRVRNLMEFFVFFKLAQSLRNQNWRTNGEKSGWKSVRPKHLDRENKKKIKMCAVLAHPVAPTKFSLTSTWHVSIRLADGFSLRFFLFFFYLLTWLTRYRAHDSLPFRLPADISNNQEKIKKGIFTVHRLLFADYKKKFSFLEVVAQLKSTPSIVLPFPCQSNSSPMRVNKDKPHNLHNPPPQLSHPLSIIKRYTIYTHTQEELLGETNVKTKTR